MGAFDMDKTRAAEIVSSLGDPDMKIDMFIHFEKLLNPHDPDQPESCAWQKGFALMCGFGVAVDVEVLQG